MDNMTEILVLVVISMLIGGALVKQDGWYGLMIGISGMVLLAIMWAINP